MNLGTPKLVYKKYGYSVPILSSEGEETGGFSYAEISVPEPPLPLSSMIVENTVTHYSEARLIDCEIDDEYLKNLALDCVRRNYK